MTLTTDPFDLARFVDAQEGVYPQALAEVRRGAKRSHWMWFIFPQLGGLGRSEMAQRYAISGLDEARAYLAHPVLGLRYREIVEALQDLTSTDTVAVFGQIDAQKLRSSLTLFFRASNEPLFSATLARWCGREDPQTIETLRETRPRNPLDGD
jgi:uncharacterized protein (DUF1810 family)